MTLSPSQSPQSEPSPQPGFQPPLPGRGAQPRRNTRGQARECRPATQPERVRAERRDTRDSPGPARRQTARLHTPHPTPHPPPPARPAARPVSAPQRQTGPFPGQAPSRNGPTPHEGPLPWTRWGRALTRDTASLQIRQPVGPSPRPQACASMRTGPARAPARPRAPLQGTRRRLGGRARPQQRRRPGSLGGAHLPPPALPFTGDLGPRPPKSVLPVRRRALEGRGQPRGQEAAA